MDDQVTGRQFAKDVARGLDAAPKFLMSRYFYDATGDRLFQEIMGAPEYYLTNCEREILREQGDAVAAEVARGGDFDLIELGSGDGSKIRFLLDALHQRGARFVFRPVDISPHVLGLLEERLHPERPWLDMQPLAANYMEWLQTLVPGERRRVFAFLGSNLGNFADEAAVGFLRAIRRTMAPDDALLIGLDLKKEPAIIEAAYDDAAGITRRFNLNLLERINRELGGDFKPERFSHCPEYDPDTGAARSFLRSEEDQEVYIAALDRSFRFAAGERIFMEVSQKYDQRMIDSLAARSGYRVAARFRDSRGWFTDQLWRPVD
jgi:dimethylhistidine N-methyltransferase